MNNCLISIIVPIFNTEKYLNQCIQSVLAQTYTYWELLLIDDGSTDASGAICEKYAAQDSRIMVFHKENGGVSSARNLGLYNAKGEWIAFVDSDDWIDSHYIYELVSQICKSDLIITGATLYDDECKLIERTKVYESIKIERSSFHLLFSTCDLHYRTSPWGKLYKKNIIDQYNIIFDEKMHHSEDAVFLYKYLLQCDQVQIHSGNLYCYRYERIDSLTKKVFDFPTEKYHHLLLSEVIHSVQIQFHIKSKDAIDNLLIRSNSSIDRVLNALYHSDLGANARIKEIKSLNINKSILQIARSFKEKFLYTLLSYKIYCLYDILRHLAVLFKSKHK